MNDYYRVEKDELWVYIDDASSNTITVSVDALPGLIGELLSVLGVGPLSPPSNHTMVAADADVNALRQLGSEWIKPARHGSPRRQRIYFAPLQGWYGLLIQPDRSATLRGQPVEELEARAIIARFQAAKVWFDVMTNTFYGAQIGREDFDFIVEQIRKLERGLDDPS